MTHNHTTPTCAFCDAMERDTLPGKRAVTQEDLDQFCRDQQERYDAHIYQMYPNSTTKVHAATHYAMVGARYARIVRADTHGPSRSVVCFIDMTNGDIHKGSWKAPVKNGVRGNIFTADRGASVMTQYGVAYLR